MRWPALASIGLFLGLAAPAVATPALPGVVSLRSDPRDCAWPLCGGWYIAPVNRSTMRCADGTLQAECYVLEVDWSALGLDPAREADLVGAASAGQALIDTTPYRVSVPGFGDFAGITPTRAWVETVP